MDRRDWRQVGGAVALAVAVMAGCGWFAGLLVPSVYPTQPGYAVPGVTEPAVDLASLQRSWPAGMGDPASEPRLIGFMKRIDKAPLPASGVLATPLQPERPLALRLAASDRAKGQRIAQVCTTCHTLDRDAPNRVGPNLWGVVGRVVASHPGFDYSGAMKGQSGSWTYDRLDHFLSGPGRAVPGTKMTFTGIHDAEDRASVLAYLGSLNTSPVPFPPPATDEAKAQARHGSRATASH